MNSLLNNDSLRKKYGYKLVANFFGLVMGFAAAAIVPRALGPQAFGIYNFLTDFFYKFMGFFDMGFSSGLYVKISKRVTEYRLLLFYSYFVAAVIVVLFFFLFIALFSPLHRLIWPDQMRFYIVLAAGYGALNWMLVVIGQLPDAYGLTVQAERIRVVQRAFFLLFLVSLYFLHKLNLTNYFIYQCLFLGSLAGLFLWLICKNGHGFLENGLLGWDKTKTYSKEFYNYCHPFFLAQGVGLGAGLLDRWLLQVYGGNLQQGFYGLSYSIGAFCFLFTSAIQPLLMREISIAHGEGNLDKMANLFRRHAPLLYTVAAFFSCFVAVEAKIVVQIFGGSRFAAAALPIFVMAFYPIHQTYGQLNATVFLASEQTRIYNKISMVFTLLGIPVTFFLIAPVGFGGLGSGAEGLAVKMVVIQILACNVQLFFISKYLSLSFWRYVGHQVISVGGLLILAAGAAYSAESLLNLRGRPLFGFIVAGFIYTVFVIGLVCLSPSIFGLKRRDVSSMVGVAIRKLKT